MRTVFNSGPLIRIAKHELLDYSVTRFGEILIPPEVRDEVVIAGLRRNLQDAKTVQTAISKGLVKVQNPPERYRKEVTQAEARLGLQLGKGEKAALALALLRGAELLLTDDEDATLVARALKLKARGVLYLILLALRDHQLTQEQAHLLLDQMIEQGLWLAPTIVQNFGKALR